MSVLSVFASLRRHVLRTLLTLVATLSLLTLGALVVLGYTGPATAVFDTLTPAPSTTHNLTATGWQGSTDVSFLCSWTSTACPSPATADVDGNFNISFDIPFLANGTALTVTASGTDSDGNLVTDTDVVAEATVTFPDWGPPTAHFDNLTPAPDDTLTLSGEYWDPGTAVSFSCSWTGDCPTGVTIDGSATSFTTSFVLPFLANGTPLTVTASGTSSGVAGTDVVTPATTVTFPPLAEVLLDHPAVVGQCDGEHGYNLDNFYAMDGSHWSPPSGNSAGDYPPPTGVVCRTYGAELAWEPAGGLTAGASYGFDVKWGADYGGGLQLYWLTGTRDGVVTNLAPVAGGFQSSSITQACESWNEQGGACAPGRNIDQLNIAAVAPAGAMGIGFDFGAGTYHDGAVQLLRVTELGQPTASFDNPAPAPGDPITLSGANWDWGTTVSFSCSWTGGTCPADVVLPQDTSTHAFDSVAVSLPPTLAHGTPITVTASGQSNGSLKTADATATVTSPTPTAYFDNLTPAPGDTLTLYGANWDTDAPITFTCDPTSVCPIADQWGPDIATDVIVPSELTAGTVITVTFSGLAGNITQEAQATATVTGPYEIAVLDSSPLSYWRLGEASGTTAVDAMGAHSGTYVGSPTLGVTGLLTGDADTAVTFDGANDVIEIPSMTMALPLTIAFWVDSNSALPVGMFDTGPGEVGVLRNYPSGEVGWQDGPRVTLGMTPYERTFLTFVFSYDGERRIDWYKNGVAQTPETGAGANSVTWTTMRWGNINNGGAGWFDGTLDEPAVWNRALSGSEAWALYDSIDSSTPTAAFATTTTVANAYIPISGDGWDPGATLSFTCDPYCPTTPDENVADVNGHFEGWYIDIPDDLTYSPSGRPYTITVSGLSGGVVRTADAVVTVTWPVTTAAFNNTTPGPGETITLSGDNWDEDPALTFSCTPTTLCDQVHAPTWWDGVWPDVNGHFGPLDVVVPADLTDGTPISITVTGRAGNAVQDAVANGTVTGVGTEATPTPTPTPTPILPPTTTGGCEVWDTFGSTSFQNGLGAPHHTDTCNLTWVDPYAPGNVANPSLLNGMARFESGEGNSYAVILPAAGGFPMDGSFNVAGGSLFGFGLNSSAAPGAPTVDVKIAVDGVGLGAHVDACLTTDAVSPGNYACYNGHPGNVSSSGNFVPTGGESDYTVSFHATATTFAVTVAGQTSTTVTLNLADAAPAVGNMTGASDFYFWWWPNSNGSPAAADNLHLTFAGPTSSGGTPILPPDTACSGLSCAPFTSGTATIGSTPGEGWVITGDASPVTSDIIPFNPGDDIIFEGTWFLDGHFTDLQMCYANGTPGENLCDSSPMANAHLGSHPAVDPVIQTGEQPFRIEGVVPAGYTGIYLNWTVGSTAGILTLSYGPGFMGESGTTTLDVSAFISLTDIPAFIDFGSALASSTVSVSFPAPCHVLTNNSAGYKLTVITSNMDRNLGGDSIGAVNFSYVVNGDPAVSPADNTTPLQLATRAVHSVATPGDPFDIDVSLAVPFVESGAYTGSAAFTASTL